MTRYLASLVVFSFAFLLVFTSMAHAAGAVYSATDSNPLDLISPVIDAFRSGNHLYAGSLALVLLVAAVRRYADQWSWTRDWTHTDLGSALLVFLGSFGTTLTVRLAASDPSWSMLWDAFCISVGAIGGYAGIKTLLIKPYLAKWASKGPAWLHAPLKLVLWIFDQKPAPVPAERSTSFGPYR